MTPEQLYQENILKIQELLPPFHDRLRQAMDECFAASIYFRIAEAFRTQQRQDMLWLQGRDASGKIVEPKKVVTWIRTSQHTLRKALDIYPVDSFSRSHPQILLQLSRIEQIMNRHGVIRPSATIAKKDYYHFECLSIPPPPPPTKRVLTRKVERAKEPLKSRLLARLRQRAERVSMFLGGK